MYIIHLSYHYSKWGRREYSPGRSPVLSCSALQSTATSKQVCLAKQSRTKESQTQKPICTPCPHACVMISKAQYTVLYLLYCTQLGQISFNSPVLTHRKKRNFRNAIPAMQKRKAKSKRNLFLKKIKKKSHESHPKARIHAPCQCQCRCQSHASQRDPTDAPNVKADEKIKEKRGNQEVSEPGFVVCPGERERGSSVFVFLGVRPSVLPT